jgi:hypothetical protein
MKWWQRKKRDADLERELRSDLELEEEEQREGGASEEEARYAALRAFGNPTLVREQTRATWSWYWFESLTRDLRLGLRALGRTRGFTVVSILVMALGIGANVALFTVVRGVLLKPLPFDDPDRLVMLHEADLHEDDTAGSDVVSGGMFAEWKKQNRSYTSLALAQGIRVGLSGSGGQLPEKLNSALISWDLLRTLGVQPALGRDFMQADDSPAANGTVLLNWGLWKRRFGGDPAILNQTIDLDARPYTVIGVMPAWFDFPDTSTQLWTPVYQQPYVSRSGAAEAGGQRVARRGRSEHHLPAHAQCAPQRPVRISKRQEPAVAGAHGRRNKKAALCAVGSDVLPAADRLPECGQSAGGTRGGPAQRAGYPHRTGRGLVPSDARAADGVLAALCWRRCAGTYVGLRRAPLADANSP